MVTLNDGKIIDEWAAVLDQCQGEEEGIFRIIEEALTAYQSARGDVEARERGARPLEGPDRQAARLHPGPEPGFNDYLMAIGARDYGSALDVSWYVLESAKGMLVRLPSKIPFAGMLLRMVGLMRELDVFDQQDPRAWVTIGHRAVQTSIKELIERRKLEVEIDWQRRGTFAVS